MNTSYLHDALAPAQRELSTWPPNRRLSGSLSASWSIWVDKMARYLERNYIGSFRRLMFSVSSST